MTEDEAEVLNTKISCLENELDSVKMELATQEDENKTLSELTTYFACVITNKLCRKAA